MRIYPVPVGEMGTNCYIIADETTNCGAVIDPGADGAVLLRKTEELGIDLKYILLTHTHYDHIGAVAELKRATGAAIAVGAEDADGLNDGRWNLSAFTGETIAPSEADVLLRDGDELRMGELCIRVLFTPGHTKGGVCFLAEDNLFAGDTLFAQSVGRSDFPGGNPQTLLHSIRTKLMTLEDSVRVYPGHGPTTTIGAERYGNPYLR